MAGARDAGGLDRFIFRRANLNIQSSFDGTNQNIFAILGTSDRRGSFVNVAKIKYLQENYRKHLKATLIPHCPSETSAENETSKNSTMWPVISRSKPLMTPPTVIVDLPDVFPSFSMKKFDWGVNGIASILGREVFVWDPKNPKTTKYTMSGGTIGDCIKWHPNGKFFVVADKVRYLSIWDFKQNKSICSVKYNCFKRLCKITSIVWMNSGKLFTGCCCGAVFFRTQNLIITNHVVQCNGEVLDLKLSANELYLSITMRTSVVVWNIRADKAVGEFPSCNARPKITDWHPWHDNIIAVEDYNQVCISNINKLNPLGYIKPPYPSSTITSFGFNNKSGELLVTYESVRNQDISSYLIIYKNNHIIVDEVLYYYGAVKGFFWDTTATQFATISSDESLCIWNFFGRNTDLDKKYRKVPKKILTTNMFETLNMLCPAVR